MTILKSLSSLDILVTDDLNIHVSYGFSYICVFLTLSGPSLPADVLWDSFVTHAKRTPKDVCGEARVVPVDWKLMINLVGIVDSSKHALQMLKNAEKYCPAASLQQIHYLLKTIVIDF